MLVNMKYAMYTLKAVICAYVRQEDKNNGIMVIIILFSMQV